ncbi:MAG: DHH family phosphoesterase, partial [Candidatus Wallbacteria bacterium]|nr:DHH family phosphoesterase [Candidatus Wallbacteria bacterium]
MKWEVQAHKQNLVGEICRTLKLPEVIARILVNREVNSVAEAQMFLYGDLKMLHSPELLSGVDLAVERIKKAVAGNEKIIIFGDYDVDGITSIALLYNFFLQIGKRVDYYIPERQCMGYGLNIDSIKRLKQTGYDLIITVDCGISNVEEVRFAEELGIDVIITDHHEPLDVLPPAVAVLNPKRPDEKY